ncbi:MAG: alpha-1,3-galactosidase B, partial [Odoribacter sp.]|nr:alpha-1,3-galactosidase B [Odoribacter sp.]
MRIYILATLLSLSFLHSAAKDKVYEMSQFGIIPNCDINCSPLLQKALSVIRTECSSKDAILLRFSPGRYHFH